MKSLSLSRPLVVMLIGVPGAGKSFFARQFADMFSAPLVSYDYLRHTLVPESTYEKEEDAVISEIVTSQLQELLKTGRTIIIDGGMHTSQQRAEIAKAAKKHDYGSLVIWVQTDTPTAEYRSIRRSSLRKGDELNSSMQPASFKRYVKLFEAPSKREEYVVISGKHTFTTQAKTVLRKIVAPREEAVGSLTPKPHSRTEKNQHVPTKQSTISL